MKPQTHIVTDTLASTSHLIEDCLAQIEKHCYQEALYRLFMNEMQENQRTFDHFIWSTEYSWDDFDFWNDKLLDHVHTVSLEMLEEYIERSVMKRRQR